MIELKGKYTNAKVFTVNNTETAIERYALAQIQAYLDSDISKDCKVRIMPDVHPGKGCVIGFTSTINDMIMPAVIGVDIGCGVTVAKLKSGSKLEPQHLDKVIRENIPSGLSIHNKPIATYEPLNDLYCNLNINKANRSLGTLGAGNHFIEVDKDNDDNMYLIVHSGSRNPGCQVASYYMKNGQQVIKNESGEHIPPELVTIKGELKDQYLHDMAIMQGFAQYNRELIIKRITKAMKWKNDDIFESIHNYIDFTLDNPIIRKGAISAKEGESVIIPINMRDGIILGTGKGNPDWNHSAPHGAGRILSRTDAREKYTVNDFKKSMKGIYSSCINANTITECPMTYRSIDDIIDVIGDTATIDKVIKPIYNFKPE